MMNPGILKPVILNPESWNPESWILESWILESWTLKPQNQELEKIKIRPKEHDPYMFGTFKICLGPRRKQKKTVFRSPGHCAPFLELIGFQWELLPKSTYFVHVSILWNRKSVMNGAPSQPYRTFSWGSKAASAKLRFWSPWPPWPPRGTQL